MAGGAVGFDVGGGVAVGLPPPAGFDPFRPPEAGGVDAEALSTALAIGAADVALSAALAG
ncbi:MAG: hypothetical protein HOV80_28240, partial [Polyangiaceae bacterium]|nr:hypothetical protein [Polyangiaceae bacterium]